MNEVIFIKTYLEIMIRIKDVEVKTNFFVHNFTIYMMILRQSYIMATKIETKDLDNGFHFVTIKNYNRKELVQFFIVRLDNEKNRD